jgi:hypothetical protein
MNEFLNAFSYFSDHVHIVGWTFIIIIAIKVSWKFSAFKLYVEGLVAKAQEVENTVDLLATNHLPHLQAGLDANIESNKEVGRSVDNLRTDLLAELRGLRGDILQYALNDARKK